MRKVYESSTALEAHMIKNLIEREGINVRIDGEYLQGGVGELQAIGIVKVMVDDPDYATAQKIVDDWELSQPAINKSKTKKTSNAINGFVFGSILTTVLFLVIYNSPITIDGVDYDGDGFYEEKWIYTSGRIKESYVDRNLDRIYDYNTYFDVNGIPIRTEADDNFDGMFETTIFFKNGIAIKEESDKNQNSIIDYRMYYKNGVLDSIEFVNENTGKIKKRQSYTVGKLTSAEFDSNGDGVFDTHYKYDVYEERLK